MARQLVAKHEGEQTYARGRRVETVLADGSEHIAQAHEPERQDRPFQVSDRPLQFEVIPLVCLVDDICHHLRLSERQFYRLMEKRELCLSELEPIDRVRRFTGESVAFEIKRRANRGRR